MEEFCSVRVLGDASLQQVTSIDLSTTLHRKKCVQDLIWLKLNIVSNSYVSNYISQMENSELAC